MRVVLVNRWHAADEPGAQIEADPLRRELAHGLAARGHEVHVVQELPVSARVEDGRVCWHFVPPARITRAARAALTFAGRDDAVTKVPAPHLVTATASLRADIVHSFDLASYSLLGALGRDTRRRGAALIAHFHGGAPARLAALRRTERAAFANVSRFFFTTREHAAPWRQTGALNDDRRVTEVYETSTIFCPGDRAEARAHTGLRGAPALLHLGRLDAVKDPLTTLAALRAVLPSLPAAHLTFAWMEGSMEAEVRAAAADLPVTFLGRVSRDQTELLLRAADVFVQASTREVCGRAALEAFATGTPSVLSDIPSFRRMTEQGTLGHLFPVGDSAAMASALVAVRQVDSRAKVRGHFERVLSFDALADVVSGVYAELRAVAPAYFVRSPGASRPTVRTYSS